MKAHGIILPLLLLGFAGGTLASPHGGPGGAPFTANCGANSVLVGAIGGAGNLVQRIQPICVKVKGDGSWDGVTYSIGMFGGSGGSYYEKVCPNGQAVVGIKGKSGTLLDQLELGCGKLGVADGKIKITQVMGTLGAVGGQGGTVFNDLCPTGEIVLGLMGAYGTVIDRIDRSCGTLTLPPPPAFAASVQASPSSSGGSPLECNTPVTFTLGASGGPTGGTTEYRVYAFRQFFTGSDTGEQIPITVSTTASSVTWTPPSAGIYDIRVRAHRSGSESSVAETTVTVRMGVTTTPNPVSPRPSPGTVALGASSSCAPPNATILYVFHADTASSGHQAASSWTTPSLATGGHTLKTNVVAIRGSTTFDVTKQIAISGTREMSYQVGGGEVFTSYFNAKHKHEKCVTCHTMSDAPSATGSLGAIKRKQHIDSGKFTASTNVTLAASCSSCHTAGNGYSTDWRAAVASQRWTETTPDLTICQTINNAPISNTNSSMHHHLTTDPRIIWAIGRMGVTMTEWTNRSTAWTNNNRSCPP